jgi:hypothetical protein
MPQYTYPMNANEPTLPVVVWLNAVETRAAHAAGRPIPAPDWGTGYLDTGTDVTCVAAAMLQRLGLQSIGQAGSHTARGLIVANLFEVSVSIPAPGPSPGPMLTHDNLLVMELADPIPGVDVLVGLDILLGCRVVLDGPGRQFTLDF